MSHIGKRPRSPMWRYERKSMIFSSRAFNLRLQPGCCFPRNATNAIREKTKQQVFHLIVKFPVYDSNGNRTRVTAVKGRCLNRLTMEPRRRILRFRSNLATSVFAIASLLLLSKKRNSVFLFCPGDNLVSRPRSLTLYVASSNSPSWARTNNPAVNSRVLYH